MSARKPVGPLHQRAYERSFCFVEDTELPIPFGELGSNIERNVDQPFRKYGGTGERSNLRAMSTSIMPDGSIVVRLAWQTVHVDVRTRAIHLRAPSKSSELGGDILESFPQVAVDRVRILRGTEDSHHLMIELRSGRSLSLGHATTHEAAMMTARVVADLTRCKVEVSEGTVFNLPGPSQQFERGVTMEQDLSLLEIDPFDEPTSPAMWEPPKQDDAPTLPRIKRSSVVPKTELVIGDGEEDPLDYTVCRPASHDEVKLRVGENSDEDAA